jgi:hypothetical protein
MKGDGGREGGGLQRSEGGVVLQRRYHQSPAVLTVESEDETLGI